MRPGILLNPAPGQNKGDSERFAQTICVLKNQEVSKDDILKEDI